MKKQMQEIQYIRDNFRKFSPTSQIIFTGNFKFEPNNDISYLALKVYEEKNSKNDAEKIKEIERIIICKNDTPILNMDTLKDNNSDEGSLKYYIIKEEEILINFNNYDFKEFKPEKPIFRLVKSDISIKELLELYKNEQLVESQSSKEDFEKKISKIVFIYNGRQLDIEKEGNNLVKNLEDFQFFGSIWVYSNPDVAEIPEMNQLIEGKIN